MKKATFTAEQVAALIDAATRKSVAVAAELHEELLHALVRVERSIVLPASGPLQVDYATARSVAMQSADQGTELWYSIYHGDDDQGCYHGHYSRTDEAGHKWETRMHRMRPDDFGTLFEAAR